MSHMNSTEYSVFKSTCIMSLYTQSRVVAQTYNKREFIIQKYKKQNVEY